MIQSTTTKKKIESKLAEWKKQKRYLHPRLTIEELSKTIGINRTYVSNFINDSYGLNFNTWINHLRIEEAKIKMTLTHQRNLYRRHKPAFRYRHKIAALNIQIDNLRFFL